MAFSRVKNLTTVQKDMLGRSGGRPNLWISKYLHRKINVLWLLIHTDSRTDLSDGLASV